MRSALRLAAAAAMMAALPASAHAQTIDNCVRARKRSDVRRELRRASHYHARAGDARSHGLRTRSPRSGSASGEALADTAAPEDQRLRHPPEPFA